MVHFKNQYRVTAMHVRFQWIRQSVCLIQNFYSRVCPKLNHPLGGNLTSWPSLAVLNMDLTLLADVLGIFDFLHSERVELGDQVHLQLVCLHCEQRDKFLSWTRLLETLGYNNSHSRSDDQSPSEYDQEAVIKVFTFPKYTQKFLTNFRLASVQVQHY